MKQCDVRAWWFAVQQKYGTKRANTIAWLLLVGFASITIRLLTQLNLSSTSLLYVGLPYLISLAIAFIRPVSPQSSGWREYRDHLIAALMVFLASSIVLFEGFVCALFFMPLYFIAISLLFGIRWLVLRRKRSKGKTLVSLLPLVLLALSLEGVTPLTTANRESQAAFTQVANLSVEQIKLNLQAPIELRKDRHWILSAFPMPYEIDAGTLSPGDVHIVRTRYHRWFFTNTHEGELHLKIAEVGPDYVRTEVVQDTTFFSSYLDVHGSTIKFKQVTPQQTQITLTVHYRRKLDPVWYFGPLQQYAVTQMAGFLIDELMIRE